MLSVKLATVRDFLARQLKPNRKLVNAVRFKDGSLSETSFVESDKELPDEPVPPVPQTQPIAGATVAQPTIGCPAPDFSPAEVRAKQVLHHFLSDQQLADFTKYDRFVATGADTGHRYMLTSRTNPPELKMFGGRTLFDLDENWPYCTHDWDVPSGEELLALLLFLSLPGRESYLRSIPEE